MIDKLQDTRSVNRNELYFCMLATSRHSTFKDTVTKVSKKKQEILRDKYDEGLYTENYYTCGKKIKKT